MKIKFALVLALIGALAFGPDTFAGDRGGRGGGKRGGGGGQKMSRPSGGARKPASRPSGGSGSFRPSGGGGNRPKPSGGNRPKPSSGNRPKPSGGARVPAKPAQRPANKPSRPAGSAGGLPSGGANKPNRPNNRPAQKPGNAGKPGAGKPNRPRPTTPPPRVNDDFLGLKPDKPGAGNRPNRPSQLPATKPGARPGNRPSNGLPANRPGNPSRPDRPNAGNRPDRPGQPQRPPRPERPEKWQNVQRNSSNEWNQWKQNNRANINNFQVNRSNEWNNINSRFNEGDWARHYGDGEFNEWRNDVRDYRRDRAEEIWDRREDYWNDCFDDDWWGNTWWRTGPFVATNASPWWWWQSAAWAGVGAFFGATIASQPVDYDPGTTVIYEGDNYYVNGEAQGTATEARREAITLSTPAVAEVPVPEPAAEGQPQEWLPLGVWALTQQEQGDATMFMQLSVNRDGLVAGAYKNVMTGDELPIVGRLDKKTQKLAWHVGDATQTVYETGLSGLQGDVASVFVHFGEKQTQTWLLVRLPSPELPPGTVKLPEVATK